MTRQRRSHLGRPRRRSEAPDRLHQRRGEAPRGGRARHRGLRARPRVPVVFSLVVLLRGGPCSRGVGRREGARGSPGGGVERRRLDPAQGHLSRPRRSRSGQRRHVRRLPARQARLPRLRASARRRLADRDRSDRRSLSSSGEGPDGPDRRQVGVGRGRSRSQATGHCTATATSRATSSSTSTESGSVCTRLATPTE